MGKLRVVPRKTKPGFISYQVGVEEGNHPPKVSRQQPTIIIETKLGTVVKVSREISLRQVARLVRLLEGRSARGLG